MSSQKKTVKIVGQSSIAAAAVMLIISSMKEIFSNHIKLVVNWRRSVLNVQL